MEVFQASPNECLTFENRVRQCIFSFLITKDMDAPGTIWSGMLGLQTARFDVLKVWDPVDNSYLDVALALESLKQEIDNMQPASVNTIARVEALEAKVEALESKVETLDERKADKFVAIAPLSLDEGVFPNELSQTEGPTPASATAISFNGVDAYIEFQGTTEVLIGRGQVPPPWGVRMQRHPPEVALRVGSRTCLALRVCSQQLPHWCGA